MTGDWKGALARDLGGGFEDRLNQAFAWYGAQGLAHVEKTPEPMKIAKSLGSGRFVAYFEKKAQADYSGVLKGGRAVALEAKFTTGPKLEQCRVTPRQAAFLDQRQALGAWCYVLAGFGTGNVYRVPWVAWRDMKAVFGRKYVAEGDLEAFRVPARGLTPMVLEGLV